MTAHERIVGRLARGSAGFLSCIPKELRLERSPFFDGGIGVMDWI
jgi:hypothetical protein